jgi:NAD(P)H-hydrate epimerase
LHIPFTENFESSLSSTDLVVDALFGFSFKPPVRQPFDKVITLLEKTDKPILAVDTPSSWNVDDGPPEEGMVGSQFMPEYLISLTAAKPSVKFYKGRRHFIGGRFLGKDVAEKYGLDIRESFPLQDEDLGADKIFQPIIKVLTRSWKYRLTRELRSYETCFGLKQ